MNKNLLIAGIAVLISFAASINLHAQNLVNDPGFESATSCTDDFDATPGWDQMDGGSPSDTCNTPDIFTPCGALITAIFGSHTPHGGNNYAGEYLYVADNLGCTPLPTANSREYMQGSLSQPLVAGQKYCVSFWIALSKNSPWATAKIGVYFSNTHLVYAFCPGTGSNGTLLPYTPQLTWCGTVLKDTATWTQLKWTYTATGGEQYFVVGNFSDDANTDPQCVNSSAFFPMMYYFYDDFYIGSGCCPDSVVFGNVTSTGCGGVSNGATASVASATCGAGTYSYNWNNGTGGTTITNVSSGTYTVTVTTTSGCSATGSINLGAGISLSTSVTNTGCVGNTGSATATVTAGTGPFTFAWSNGATTSAISNLAAGTYTLTVSNTTGCSATATDTVGSSGNITLTPAATASTCGNNNGTASVTASGGTGYTYSWSNSGTTASISNLSGGTYTVTVSASGCSASASAVVGSSSQLTLSPSQNSTTCGNNNGMASVSVTPSGSYTYLWSNSATTSSITSLAAGTYNVTVSAGAGCSATSSAVISSSTGITLVSAGGTASCTSNGSGSVRVVGGTGPFFYNWSNNDTTSSIDSLSAGTYSVTVTGAGGCTATATITVTASGNGVTLTSTATPSGCSDSSGAASVTATTGVSPFTYAWSNGATTSSIQNAAAGNYTVTVTATGGCSASASINVSAAGALNLTTSFNNATCGNSNGSAGVTATGSGPYTYSWSNGSTTNSISNLASGTYTVTVHEGSSCSGTASMTINSSGDSITIQAQPAAVCKGDTSQICAPAGYQSYSWNTGETSQCISATQQGNYYVTVTDPGSCTATSNHITLTVNTADTVHVATSLNGDTLEAGNAVSYQWYYNNAPISGATSADYVATQPGNYYVETTGANGCPAPSNVVVVKTVLGISEVNGGSDIKVYPNPLANGNWHLDVTSDWIGSDCEVYDAAGRLVYRAEIKSTQTEFELNVAQGVYVMQINSTQKNYAIKLIKL